MMLRNVNLAGGLCNGTRLIVTSLMTKLIEAKIITGTRVGEKVYIHRIPLTHKDPNLDFIFKCTQFPIKLCYAMTINKSQGQSLSRIGIYLPEPVFIHGQLYVALSRATSPNGLKLLIHEDPTKPPGTTKNIVYKELLSNVTSRKLLSPLKMSDTIIPNLKMNCADNILEARIYRTWTSRGAPGTNEQAYSCILIDRQGNAIQGNMDNNNSEYFKSKFRAGLAYRITRFFCENTSNFQQTLNNPISLRFGRITDFKLLEGREPDFPKHHFEFISYHQLPSRIPYIDKETGSTVYPILTEFLGRVQSISDIIPSGDAQTGKLKSRGWMDT